MSKNSKKSFVVVGIALIVLVLASLACSGDGGSSSGNGCANGVALNAAGTQYVCKESVNLVKDAQVAVDQGRQALEQKAAQGYKESMKDSTLRQAAPAIKQATGTLNCGNKGTYTLGSQTFCNP